MTLLRPELLVVSVVVAVLGSSAAANPSVAPVVPALTTSATVPFLALEAAPDPDPAPDQTQDDVAAPILTASQARAALERGMTELAELAARARQSGDLLRVACVQEKQDRAGAVMEVATGEILSLQDGNLPDASRSFAEAKLTESAQQMRDLVNQARACQGREDAANIDGQNEAITPQVVMPLDPTTPASPVARGLPPIDPRPPVASPVL